MIVACVPLLKERRVKCECAHVQHLSSYVLNERKVNVNVACVQHLSSYVQRLLKERKVNVNVARVQHLSSYMLKERRVKCECGSCSAPEQLRADGWESEM